MFSKDSLAKLENLYGKTGMDWDLRIDHCLTEPTCPTISIQPEGMSVTRYTVWCDPDKVEEALAGLVDRVHREVILGETIEPSAPFTNPDDVKLVRLLGEWGKSAPAGSGQEKSRG